MTLPVFLNKLNVELTGRLKQGRPVWLLLKPLTLRCEVEGIVYERTAPRGFETDFASVPRAFWRFAPPGGLYAGAAVIHDWLYINRIDNRLLADQTFLEGMKAAGVSALQRSLIFRAVRLGGAKGWGR